MFQPEKPLPINVIIINNTSLSMEDSKCNFLGSFRRGDNVPICSALGVLEDTYALQNVPRAPAPEPASSAGLQSHHGSLSEDYGLVHREDGNQVQRCPYNPHATPHCVGGVTSYKAQAGMTELPPQERYENEEEINEEGEEEGEGDRQIYCNWDRDNGKLQLDFPLLSRFGSETSDATGTTGETLLLTCRPVLTSVVVKQASEESGDDDPLLKMENEWALQVQSVAE